MGIALALSELYVPERVKNQGLKRLFEISAAAFQSPPPANEGLPYSDRLKLFAEFTREQSQKYGQSPGIEDAKRRLFEGTLQLGGEYRARFRLKTVPEVMRMARVIYRQLGIDFRGGVDGEARVGRCFFSSYYSSEVCRVVASLDEGLMAGLSGGGEFRFSERITEGEDRCIARLSLSGMQR